jgi:anti-sigma B factor antagonist
VYYRVKVYRFHTAGGRTVECKERRVKGAVVVDIEGKLVGGPGSENFHELVKRLLDDGEKRFVFNLEKTPWANSTGIGLLIGALTSISREGGKIVLANGCQRIQDILRVTRLSMIFDCYDDTERAVNEVLAANGGGAARLGGTRSVVPI